MKPPDSSSPLQSVLDELDLRASSTSATTMQAVVDLAIEIAHEGREGRKIGTLFTVGAENEVLPPKSEPDPRPSRRTPARRPTR